MRHSLNKLFPFLGLAFTTVCFIVFISWNKLKKEASKPGKPAKPAKPTTRRPPKTTEGFQSSQTPNTVLESIPTIPQYAGPVIRFIPTVNDSLYDEYELQNLYPSQEMIDANNLTVVSTTPTQDYGSALSQFDATSIDSIPWDADNTTYEKKDILWGIVSEEASKSIFLKTYRQNLSQDASNFTDSPNPQYYSPILGIATRDPSTSAALSAFDMAAPIVAQLAMTHRYEKMVKDMIKNNMEEITKLAKINQARAGTLAGRVRNMFSFAGSADNLIREAAQELIEAQRDVAKAASVASKSADNIALTSSESLFKTVKLSAANKLIVLKEAIKKALEPVAKLLKRLGTVIAAKLAPLLSKVGAPVLMKLLTVGLTKFGIALGVIISQIVAGFALMAAVVTAPIGAALVALHTPLLVIDITCMVIAIVIMIVLPTIFDKGLENGGTCKFAGKNGLPLDRIIEDPVAYFIFSSLTPIGTIMDAFGPYVCYENGNSYFKKGLVNPKWSLDASYSLYKHNVPDKLMMRGERTWYTDNIIDPNIADPTPGWKRTDNTWRKNCEGGTWTSSDVDALCNAASYVPKTYTKKSKVPRTLAKETRVPPTTVKDTYITTYMREIRWRNMWWDNGIQYTDCSTYNYTDLAGVRKEFSTTLPLDLHCAAQCNYPDWQSTKTSFMCTDNVCRSGYTIVAGVCWKNCNENQHDVGALCRDKCKPNEEDEVAGVCWKKCSPGFKDVWALCREECAGETPEDKAGICWGGCNAGDKDVGMLCREKCPEGMEDKSGICWTRDTYARETKTITSIKNYDAGYQPPHEASQYEAAYNNLADHKSKSPPEILDWCDYSSRTMLNRMAQFYYDQAFQNATIDTTTNLISYEFIIMFYGLIASSELSCDVACAIKSVKYNPITGDDYDEVIGAYYPEDPGNSVSYRRFYFIKDPKDPSGVFTVTGCTHVDYTAPDAMVRSTDPGVEPITSLPKVFNFREKMPGGISFSPASFASSLINVGAGLAVGVAGGTKLGMKLTGGFSATTAGQVAGGLSGGIGGQALSKVLSEAMTAPPIGLIANKAVRLVNGVPFVYTNNDGVEVNYGPIYEYNASIGVGEVPEINFCAKAVTTTLLCTDKNILRDTIDEYHRQNTGKRIKTVRIIEPRTKDNDITDSGCYYKWDEVDYNAQTNTEGGIITSKEVLYKYRIPDFSTCAFAPTREFITDLTKYPIRKYYDEVSNKTIYPTRSVIGIPITQARYVRILPSAATNTLELSQIVIYDSNGTNIALNKQAAVSSTAAGFTTSSSVIIDGTGVARKGAVNTWRNANTNAGTPDYFQVDLGENFLISSVLYIGRLDATNVANNMGVRIQLYYSVEATATPVVEKLTGNQDTVQTVEFTTPQINPRNPLKPFVIPRPLPPKTNLAGMQCPVRCEDKPQIDAFINTYNTTPSNTSKILKVLKANTSSANRCDYEVEMISVDSTTGNKLVSKEHIKQKVDISGTPIANAGIVYGRYVRLRPPLEAGDGYLRVSQVVVTSPGTPQKTISIAQPVYATSFYKYAGIKNVTQLPSAFVNQNVPLNVSGRYVRVYASKDMTVGDKANFALSYVGVFNGGTNVSTGKSASATSSLTGSALPASIVNLTGANIKAYNWTATDNKVWANSPKPGADRDLDYFQIDLGFIQNVTSIKIITRADFGSDATGSGAIVAGGDRTTGIRVAVLSTLTDSLVYASTAAQNSATTDVTVDDAKIINPYERRALPNIWQNASKAARTTDYWEVDLGSIQPIDSITYYPGSIKTINGVRVQVLTENNIASQPTYDQAIVGDATDATPYKLIQFNKCEFKYSRATADMTGDFIQDNTPFLSAIDTVDGVMSFKNIGNNIINVFNEIVTPLTKADPLGILNQKAISSDNTAKNILGSVATNQKLNGCPAVKCNDVSSGILTSIMSRYNEVNAPKGGEQFGVESRTMTQILKAATSGPNTCDIVFNELYTAYDDYLYPPTESTTSIKAKRFTLNNKGNCVFEVDRGDRAIRDISLNEVTIGTNDSILKTVFKSTQCSLDCRNDTYIAGIKLKLSQSSPTTSFTTIKQSVATGPTTCEYTMLKDVATKDSTTGRISSESGLETYVKATFTSVAAGAGCTYTVDTVKEYDPEAITSNTRSGEEVYYINGVAIELPYLYNYDNTVTGSRVDETVKII